MIPHQYLVFQLSELIYFKPKLKEIQDSSCQSPFGAMAINQIIIPANKNH